VAEGRELGQVPQQLPVVLGVLGETETRIEDDLLGRDPPDDHLGETGLELFAHVGDDIAVGREVVHLSALTPPVHRYVVQAGLGDRAVHLGIGEPPRDVIDHGCPRLRRGERGRGVHGVDAHGHAGAHELADHGHHTRLLLRRGHPFRTGTRRLAPHIHEIGTLITQLDAVGDGRVDRLELSAVTERVRCDVEHTHDLRHAISHSSHQAVP
jgi:hypothetical protein